MQNDLKYGKISEICGNSTFSKNILPCFIIFVRGIAGIKPEDLSPLLINMQDNVCRYPFSENLSPDTLYNRNGTT